MKIVWFAKEGLNHEEHKAFSQNNLPPATLAEESANASKEMTAQASSMIQYISRLSRIVSQNTGGQAKIQTRKPSAIAMNQTPARREIQAPAVDKRLSKPGGTLFKSLAPGRAAGGNLFFILPACRQQQASGCSY